MSASFDPGRPVFDVGQSIYTLVRDFMREMARLVLNQDPIAGRYLFTMTHADTYATFLNEKLHTTLREAFCHAGDWCGMSTRQVGDKTYLDLVIQCYSSNPVYRYIHLPEQDVTLALGWMQTATMDTLFLGKPESEVYTDLVHDDQSLDATIPLKYLPSVVYMHQVSKVNSKVQRFFDIRDYLEQIPDDRRMEMGRGFDHLFRPSRLVGATVQNVMDPNWQSDLNTALWRIRKGQDQAMANRIPAPD
jgi:hypothetical protein